MAIDWGPARETSTNGIRVGIDLSYSGSGSSRDVVFELWVWTKRESSGSSASFSRSWDFASSSGSFSYSHSTSGTDWPTSNQTRIGRWTASASLNYGSTRTINASGSVSGLSGNMPSGSTSHSASVTLPARPYLAAQSPSNLSVNRRSSTRIDVSWTRRVSTARPVDNVRVQRQTNTTSGSWEHIALYSSSDSVTNTSGVSAGNRYRYRVRAEGPGGNSSWVYSSWTGYAYLAPSAPSAPSWVRVSDSQHSLSWSLNASSAAPYDSQRVQRRHYYDGWTNWYTVANVSGTAESYADRSTADGRVYQWRIQAVNGSGTGTSLWSAQAYTTPWRPFALEVEPTAAGNVLSWSNQVRYTNYDYQIQHRADGGAWADIATHSGGPSGTRSSWTHSDPDVGVVHGYRIRSRYDGLHTLYSVWQVFDDVQLAAPPAAPSNLGPASTWDASEDRGLTWRHVPQDGSGQARFQVRHRLQGEAAWTTVAAVASPVSRWVLPGGTYEPGDTIEWQVRTGGVHPDWSPWSASDFQEPTERPTVTVNAPEPDLVVGTSSVLVSWGYVGPGTVGDEVGGQAAWRLTLLRGSEVVAEESGSDDRDEYVVHGLADGESYSVRVEVRSGQGLWSDPDEVTFPVSYLEPDAPTIDAVGWDVELGAATVTIAHAWEDGAEPAFHQLWRAIGDGPWLLIEDEIPLDTGTISDPIPAIGDGTVNYYRVRTVSVLPSTADSETAPLTVPSTGRGGTRGWVYLNGGPGMATVCRVRANATRGDREGLAKDTRRYRGRRSPVLRTGTAHSLTWDVSARIAPDYDGASTRAELVELQGVDGPVMYRDPLGARWFGAMGEISSSWRSIHGEVEWSMVQVDYIEGLATDSAGPDDGGGDDDDEGGGGESDPQ